jgi:hypothetical protein
MALVADGFCDALPFGYPRPQPAGRGLIFGFYHFCLARWCPSLSWRLLSVVDFISFCPATNFPRLASARLIGIRMVNKSLNRISEFGSRLPGISTGQRLVLRDRI